MDDGVSVLIERGPQKYNVHFIKLPIELSAAEGDQEAIVDPNGLLYVVHEEEEAIRANNDLKYPLVFRANMYDCMDWTLTSEWEDDDITNFQSSKDQYPLPLCAV